MGFSPWGREESDVTEGLTLSFFLSSVNLFFSPVNGNHKIVLVSVRNK